MVDNLTKAVVSSDFITVQILMGLGNLLALQSINMSALWYIKVSINQGMICTDLYRQVLGTMHVCPWIITKSAIQGAQNKGFHRTWQRFSACILEKFS